MYIEYIVVLLTEETIDTFIIVVKKELHQMRESLTPSPRGDYFPGQSPRPMATFPLTKSRGVHDHGQIGVRENCTFLAKEPRQRRLFQIEKKTKQDRVM